jgi:hypothetical protein
LPLSSPFARFEFTPLPYQIAVKKASKTPAEKYIRAGDEKIKIKEPDVSGSSRKSKKHEP